MDTFGYNVNPVTHDGDIDLCEQRLGLPLIAANDVARLLSGARRRGSLKYAKVRVHNADTGMIVAEFLHGDRLTDHRTEPTPEASTS